MFDFNTIYNNMLKQREKAPCCPICGIKLFDYLEYLDQYIYKKHHYLRMKSEDIHELYNMFFYKYPYQKEEKSLVKHHISYKQNKTIPVCRTCHQKIHKDKSSEYYPIDKKPCNHKLKEEV